MRQLHIQLTFEMCRTNRSVLLTTVLCIMLINGCAPWRLPKIDPNGESLFIPGESTTITPPFQDPEQFRDFLNPFPKPAFQAPRTGSSAESTLLTPAAGATATDPAQPGSIWISSKVMAAPVGSSVVLKAGLVGKQNRLLTGRKLEWTIANGSVGKIESAGGGNPNTFRWLFPHYGNKVTDFYAHALSAKRAEVVRNETATTIDDVEVRPGESWVTVVAQQTGTTKMLVGAATESDWDRQFQQIQIHWVDAQWQFPSPVSAPAGQDQTLSTSLVRQSDQSPLVGWSVRYRLISNRAATLSSTQNDEQLDSIEVQTDSTGTAAIRVTPNQKQSGVVRVLIEVIRPANEAQQTPSLVMGESSAQVTWNAPELAIRATGPATVEGGNMIRYNVAVSNPGNQTATNVVVTQNLPFAMNVESSNPVANITGQQATWKLGDISPQTEKQITIQYQTDELGSYNQLLTATCLEGLESVSESLTNVVQSPLEIAIKGPQQARLHETVQFQISIHNRSNRMVNSVKLVETLGPGLVHVSRSAPQGNPSHRKIAFQYSQIEPGQTMVKLISMRATQTGSLCHQLQVFLPAGLNIRRETCLEISGSHPTPAPDLLRVEMKGPMKFADKSTNKHRFHLTNMSAQPITNITIEASLPDSLESQQATEGHRIQGRTIVLDIESLQPGQTRTLVVQSLAIQAATEQRIALVVTGDALQRIEKQLTLNITPVADINPLDLATPPDHQLNPDPPVEAVPDPTPAESQPPELQIKMAVLKEPIKQGEENIFFLYIHNMGKMDATRIITTVTASDGLHIIAITNESVQAAELAQTVAADQKSALLPAIDKLAAGQKLTPYKIRVKAVKAGQQKLDISLQADNLKTPVTASDSNRIIPVK